LNDFYKLSPQEIADYQKNGHICLRGVASVETIASVRPKIQNVVKRLNNNDKPLEQRDTYGKAFIQVGNVWQEDVDVQAFIFAQRYAKIAADLMGVDAVRIYHDQALFKEPGGGHTPWHQDQVYWPLATNHTITMWMPLVPVSEEVGSMTFVSDAHHSGYITKQVISDESHQTLKDYIAAKGLTQVNYGALQAGDATFHSGWTLHAAPGNPTDTMREVITIIYYADGTPVSE
jgi:ectoine hydroxylase-related dioxygenase (phytanoyl-CoA dioxygenase family)